MGFKTKLDLSDKRQVIQPEVVTETSTTTNTKEVNVEVIYSEDNNIELNYEGTHETALNGGLTLLKGVSETQDSYIKSNEMGDWELLPNISLKYFTPTSTQDPSGNKGNVVFDDNFLYIKTQSGWKRCSLEEF